MCILILYFPFIGAFFSGILGRYLGSKGSQFITTFFMFLNLLLSFIIFNSVIFNNNILHFIIWRINKFLIDKLIIIFNTISFQISNTIIFTLI